MSIVNKIKYLINKYLLNIIYCDYCQIYHNKKEYKTRRLNTCYTDDKLNFMYSCEQLYKDTVEMYKEQWEDYYRSR